MLENLPVVDWINRAIDEHFVELILGTSYTTARARVARIAMADRAGLGVLDRCWINQQVFPKAYSAQTLYLLKN